MPIPQRLLRVSGFGVVMGNEFRLRLCDLRETLLE
jgi:hypothetical protein